MMFRYCNQLSGCYPAVCTSSSSDDIDSHLLTLVTSSHPWIWPISVWFESLLWDKIDDSLWDEEILISERICMTVTNTPVCVFGSILCKQAYTVVRRSDEFLKFAGSPWVKCVLIRLQSELIQVHWSTTATTCEIDSYPLQSPLRHLRSTTSCSGAPLSATTTVTAVRHCSCGVRPRYSPLGHVVCQPHHRQVTLTSSSIKQAALGWGRKKIPTGGNSASRLVNVV